jgi:hypothetical protein
MLVLSQKGHPKKYCWQTKKSEEKSTKEANLAVTNSGMTNKVLSISSNLQYQEEWHLDSATCADIESGSFLTNLLMRV